MHEFRAILHWSKLAALFAASDVYSESKQSPIRKKRYTANDFEQQKIEA